MTIRIIMDSGKEYTIEMDISDFQNKLIDYQGVLLNGFVDFGAFIINPSHISSIEEIDTD